MRVVVTVLAVIALAGCGGGGGPSRATRQPSPAASATSAPSATASPAPTPTAAQPGGRAQRSRLEDRIRSDVQAATRTYDPATNRFDEAGLARLRSAAAAWERYRSLSPRPDPRIAAQIVLAFAPGGLEEPAAAVAAQEAVVDGYSGESRTLRSSSLAQLAILAARAGQERKATLAAQRAVQLSPAGRRSALRRQLRQIVADPESAPTVGP